uniref:Apoptosis-associated speck-like protein containing a CARD n=1 Tax=Gopherus evgoodei TaxID=1825980 RepID=A0A8C4WDH2_9SAUR
MYLQQGRISERNLLLEALDDLGEDNFKRFKNKLRAAPLEERYKAISWLQLEKGDPVDVSNLLISHYGERYGVEVTVQVLGDINQRDLAERLSRAGKEQMSLCVALQSSAQHFVSQHREQLIQQVMAVDGILDSLCGSVLDLEQIQSIRAERSSMEKMRKLYELVPKWDNDCKDRLYQALKEKHRPLVEELEGI